MDAIPAAVNALLNALQSVTPASAPATAAPVPALLALAGQDVSMLLLGSSADGEVSLGLPSGQVVTAQGQLPYPEGSQLLVRILAGGTDAPLRLQTLQATPPPAPAILAPLRQGEAAPLQARLAEPDPPPELAALVDLDRLLGQTETAPAPGTSSAAVPLSVPPQARIQAALATLPEASAAALKTVLDLPQEASPGALASALETWLNAAHPGAPALADPVQAFQSAVARHPDLPAGQGEALVPWLRQLLRPDPAPAAAPSAAPRALAPGPAQALQQQLVGHTGAPAELPATWEAWIKTSVRALNDPAVSPQGAAFHAAQAQEGTAFYELPLPWAPQHPLQMWVEYERDPRHPASGAQPEIQRVLLGLAFSSLGETRLGIARSGGDLQVRVWAEHPEPVEAARAAVQEELQALGGSVDLKVLALPPGPGGSIPSLRSQVTGATLEALG